MALIKCPECKQPISSTVSTCPRCGYVLTESDREEAVKAAAQNPVSFYEPQQKQIIDQGSGGGGFCLGFFLGLIGLIIAICGGKPDTKTGAIVGFIIQAILSFVITVAIYAAYLY